MSPRFVPLSVAAVIVAVLALAGCSDEAARTADAPAASASASGPAATLQLAVAPERAQTWRAVAAAYDATAPAVGVEVVEVGGVEDRLALLGQGGTGPDLVLLRDDEYAEVARDGVLAPLQGLLGRRGTDLDAYLPLAVDAFTRQGALQCMPVDASPLVVYVNRTLLEAVGTQPPVEGWTFRQLVATLQGLVNEDVDGIGLEPSLDTVASFAWSAGAEVSDDPDSPTRLTLSRPDTRQVVGLLASLRTAGLLASPEELDEADAVTRFGDGRLAMLVGDRSLVPVLRKARDLVFDVVPLPVLEEPASVVHPLGLCLDATTEDASAAADFVAWAAGPDGQAAAAREGGVVPVLSSVAGSDAFLDPTVLPQHSSVFVDALDGARLLPTVPGWAEVDAEARSALTSIWYDAGSTAAIDRAVADLEAAARPLLGRR